MKIQPQFVVTGGNGMVGQAIQTLLGDRSRSFSHADCDITNASQVESLIGGLHPQAVFNCAAITNVDQCETDHAIADAVNVQGVENLAKSCQRHGATLIHFSTDYVFDGVSDTPFLEDHPRSPINYYGQSKAASEDRVREFCPDHIIARVQWVFGTGRHNFIMDAAQRFQAGQEVKAFADQFGTPTSAHDIAEMITQLLFQGHRGTFHTVNQGYASRVEIAETVAQVMGVATPHIIGVNLKDVTLPAKRPAYSCLSIDKIQKLGIHPPTWQDAVGRYLCSTIKKSS